MRIPHPPPPGTPSCGRCHGALDISGKPQEVDGEALARAVAASSVPGLMPRVELERWVRESQAGQAQARM